jgi:hypothetical protein
MFGGLLKSTSLAALMAVAGVTLSGFSANAADLGVGGNCCADLEERIAELEATTVRKGNRKVSLTVSGWVNESVMFWDDGVESNAYVGTNENARSRFRFVGSAKIDSKWSAGYLLEIGVRGNNEGSLSQNISSAGKGLDVRHSAWYLQNTDLGKVWVGQTSQASDGITEINLANTGHFAGVQWGDYLQSFNVRGANGKQSSNNIRALVGGGSTQVGNPGEGFRYNVVKYETPTLAGFSGSASWGEDKFWDLALRYAGEFSGVKLAAGLAYTDWNDGTENTRNCVRVNGINGSISCNELGLSGSVMHVPTGLYATGAYGYKEDDNRNFIARGKKDDFYRIEAGIEQAFFPVGKSTLFGEYYEGTFRGAGTKQSCTDNGTGGSCAGNGAFTAAPVTDANLGIGSLAKTTVNYWGVGFNQNVAAAAMDVYVSYRNYSFDIKDAAANKANVNDIQTVLTGARIQF